MPIEQVCANFLSFINRPASLDPIVLMVKDPEIQADNLHFTRYMIVEY